MGGPSASTVSFGIHGRSKPKHAEYANCVPLAFLVSLRYFVLSLVRFSSPFPMLFLHFLRFRSFSDPLFAFALDSYLLFGWFDVSSV